ncbi:MAG TPA: M6 family metalloprotease domain-containing protein, partial [Candidatus Eisenbacteria bacterium]|nr:M6 family metalloprotease domain-containing protein [Candidatus Eisenbacteria bacterium]
RPADVLAHPPSYFEELLFSTDRIETGSLREWYEEATQGKIAWEGRAFGWFRMPLTYAEYASDESGFCTCYPNNAQGLVDHAISAARAADIDLSDFDNDGPDQVPGSGDDDGILDGLAVVFAGLGAERTGQTTDLRSHYSTPTAPLELNGIRLPDYVLIPENENIGVAVHEIGHLLGAIDLYDLTGRAAGLGYYSVMAYGIWFNNARQPGGPDPYTRLLWGVLEPEVLQVDETGLELLPILESGHVMQLWTRGERGPEYFLLEHRTTGGMDRFLFGDGLLLYHVDENVGAQTNPSHYRVDLVQADGLRTLNGAGTVRNLGEFGDYFPGSTGTRVVDTRTVPSTLSYAGESTGVALRNIGDPAPHITFDAEVGRFLGTGPDPRLSILPDGDPFASAMRPGETHTVRLQIENQGTRLGAGSVRVFSRDARVTLPQ